MTKPHRSNARQGKAAMAGTKDTLAAWRDYRAKAEAVMAKYAGATVVGPDEHGFYVLLPQIDTSL